jgi:hypothetical protein
MDRRSITRSWLWPVAAYAVMGFWLLLVNAENLGIVVAKPNYYWILGEMDSIAHFATALAITAVAQAVFKKGVVVVLLLALIAVWEVFEIVTLPALSATTLEAMGPYYYFDTLHDVAFGIFGLLIGANVVKE